MIRPTIKTICELTGLSTATVSKALRHSDEVRPQTRAIVLKAAESVGYRRNLHGVQLRTGKTFQIAAIMNAPAAEQDEWEGVEYSELLSGITRGLEGTPYRVALYAARSFQEAETAIRQIISERQADGIILSGTRPDDSRIRIMQDVGFPFVSYGMTETNGAHPYVDADNAWIIRTTMERLISKGHRRIALLNPPGYLTYSGTRLAMYRQVSGEYSIAFDPDLVAQDKLTPSFGCDQVQRMNKLNDPPTAYICANEAAALGALAGFNCAGIVHGKDAVINATDDLNISAFFTPPLTTFYLPIGRPSALLGDHILRRIAGEPVENLQTLLRPDFMARSDDSLTK
jgi:LacI family transcriptional regulator